MRTVFTKLSSTCLWNSLEGDTADMKYVDKLEQRDVGLIVAVFRVRYQSELAVLVLSPRGKLGGCFQEFVERL